MNNLFKPLCKALAVVALVGVASSAFANSVKLNVGAYSDSCGGGEFTASGSGLPTGSYALTTSSSDGSFETFCMAYNEEFVPGTVYEFSLGNSAKSNDSNVPYSPLTEGTAWLYSQFAAGTLFGYDYTNADNGRASSALQLQEAIWELQGQAAPNGDATYFITLVDETLGKSVADATATGTADGVQVMVLTGINGYGTTPYSQPQLYYNVPDNGTTMLLVAGALFALLGFKRRFKNI